MAGPLSSECKRASGLLEGEQTKPLSWALLHRLHRTK